MLVLRHEHSLPAEVTDSNDLIKGHKDARTHNL